jgi:hypothetical protein
VNPHAQVTQTVVKQLLPPPWWRWKRSGPWETEGRRDGQKKEGATLPPLIVQQLRQPR